MYFKSPVSLSLIGIKVEFLDQFGTYLLNASNSSSRTSYNNLAVKKLSNINTRVNITCSVYNYLYIEELIDFLCQDWPSVVSFGSPRNNYLIESAVPLDHREDMISSLKRAVEIVQQTDIESGQKSNAINALTAHLTNLKTKPCVDADYDQLCDFIARMDKVKNIRMEDYCPDLSVVFK